MRVLILSITAGQGHHATAQALSRHFVEKGHSCSVLDTYEYLAPLLKEAVAQGYLIATAYTPGQFKRFYRLAETKKRRSSSLSLSSLANKYFAYTLKTYIEQTDPHIIICTHVFSAIIMNIYRERFPLKAVTAGIVTDFTLHPFWEDAAGLDYFVTPSELLAHPLLRKGISLDKMLPFGIPIHDKFSRPLDKTLARKSLELDEHTPALLLMSGSMGYGSMDKAVQALLSLDSEFQIMAVCGNNSRQFDKLSRLKTDRTLKVYPFVNNIDVMMSAADLIITKPGGISTSEAMAKELPLVMLNPIPGQEDRNADFLRNYGLGLLASKTFPLEECIYSLTHHPEQIEVMRQNMRRLGKKNATARLCDFLEQEARARFPALLDA